MTNEILYTGQLRNERFLELLRACLDVGMFLDALVLAEQFPDHMIKRKQQQNLLFFDNASTQIPWEAGAIPWHTYTSGRLFTDNWELRWARQLSGIRVVYLGASGYDGVLRDYHLDEKSDVLTGLKKKSEPNEYYLFGERLRLEYVEKIVGARPGDFAEARIPRLLRYPPANCKEEEKEQDALERPYMQLWVCEYTDEAGSVVLSRFQCLKAAKG